MKDTTLCYIEKDNKYLMLNRSNKKNDGSQGKWMGIGGHFEEGESPYDCVVREAMEETGLTLISPQYRAVVTFNSDKYETEQMHLFTCKDFTGNLVESDEGSLKWIDKEKLSDLNMWSGDIIFLKLLETEKSFFSLKLTYKGEALKEYYLNGKLVQ
ncbi:MAG: 8-oxo-dGTP diphosphatase [Clostridia bacterium]|nr:8-oxo-dGTP diphosphatase [Clostridia bacterium]